MTCKLCRGMLKIIRVEEGEVFAIDCPNCRQEVVSEKMTRANLPKRYLSVRFTNSKMPSPEYEKSCRSLSYWCQSPEGFVTISGPPGSGKTHMLACMAAQMIDSGLDARYLSLIDLFDDERRRIGKQPVRDLYLLESAPILLVDELGAGIGTEFEKDVIHRLVARRYDDMRPTVFATNFRFFGSGAASLESSGRGSTHTFSRLSTSTNFETIESFRGGQ